MWQSIPDMMPGAIVSSPRCSLLRFAGAFSVKRVNATHDTKFVYTYDAV
jgi:hypothetical protein